MTREQRLKQTIWETVMEGTAHCGWTDRAREGLVKSVQDAVLCADHAAPAGDDGEVLSWTEYHGCFTGDCPHSNANECVAEIRKFAKEVEAEMNAARAHAPRSQGPNATVRDVMASNAELCQENYELRRQFGELTSPRSQGADQYPTPWAYEQACRALEKYRVENRQLREAIASRPKAFLENAKWISDMNCTTGKPIILVSPEDFIKQAPKGTE